MVTFQAKFTLETNKVASQAKLRTEADGKSFHARKNVAASP